MAIEIIGTGKAAAPERVSNDDLAARIDTNDEWIRSHTGIGNRHIAPEGVFCSALAALAAKKALAASAGFFGEEAAELDRIAAEEAGGVDLIVLATVTPDYYGVPPTACIVQNALGAGRAAAMDVSACCTGFVYGLEAAAGMLNISAGRKRALVIGAEVLSRITDWTDRGSCILFGDGAGAVLIEKTGAPSAGEGRRGLLRTVLGADGSGWESLVVRRGGSSYPFKTGEVVGKPPHIEMNGQEVYNFAVRAITDTVEALIKAEGIKSDDIARIVPHQANARIVRAAAKRLKIPFEKFFLNIEEYANTSAASIPIALDELQRAGSIKKGDMVMTIGFGGGLTYGGNLIIW